MKFLIYFAISALVFFFIVFNFIFGKKMYVFVYLKIKDMYKFIGVLRKDNEKIFDEYGFRLYCGLGGSGKTLAIVEQLKEYRSKYPKLWICTNFETPLANCYINDWQDLINIDNPNGLEYGVVFAFDEIHLTFNSSTYKDRPDDLLEYISQQRKMRKLILGSAQVFARVDKVLREQSNLVIECNTILKRWNFQRAYKTEDYLVNGDMKDKGMRKRLTIWKRNFIATDEIRGLYDTYQIMKPLIKKDKKTKTYSIYSK